MPIYEDESTTREDLFERRKKSRCQVCRGELDVFMDFDKGKAFLACRDWKRTHHEGIEREAPPLFEPNIVTRREEMDEQYGKGKGDALAKYFDRTSLQKVELKDIIETLWPEAPQVEKAKAIMLCVSYVLNPLKKHIYLIPFNKGEPDETWALVMSIQSKRLLASRRGPFSYVDNTPRIMTDDEQLTTFGEVLKDRLYVVTKLRDPSTGAESVGHGFWLKKDKVKGENKGNTPFNMAAIRSESQALDRLRPGEMPLGIEAIEAEYSITEPEGGEESGEAAKKETAVTEPAEAISSPPKEGLKPKKVGESAPPAPKIFKNWGELAQAAQSLGVMPSDIFKRAGVKKWDDFADFRDAWNYVEEIITERAQKPKLL